MISHGFVTSVDSSGQEICVRRRDAHAALADGSAAPSSRRRARRTLVDARHDRVRRDRRSRQHHHPRGRGSERRAACSRGRSKTAGHAVRAASFAVTLDGGVVVRSSARCSRPPRNELRRTLRPSQIARGWPRIGDDDDDDSP
jgi:hypothetical protein